MTHDQITILISLLAIILSVVNVVVSVLHTRRLARRYQALSEQRAREHAERIKQEV